MSQIRRRTVPWRSAVAAILIAPLMASCSSNLKRALGWDKPAPDEFQVIARAPLSQPPDYDLRPPNPGATRPNEVNSAVQARKELIGPSGATAPAGGGKGANPELMGLSTGEQSLLKKAGADRPVADIRTTVDAEASASVAESQSFTDDILFWQTKPPPGTVVDPNAEAKRLQSNASLGLPPTEGDSPVIVRKQKGWLEGIF